MTLYTVAFHSWGFPEVQVYARFDYEAIRYARISAGLPERADWNGVIIREEKLG